MSVLRTGWFAVAAVVLLSVVALAASVAAAPAASAATPAVPPMAAVAVEQDDSIIEIGKDVTIAAGRTVGAVVVIGGDVRVDGTARDAVLAVGGEVVVNGTARDIVAAIGGDVAVSGEVGHTVLAVGGDVDLGPSAVVGRRGSDGDTSIVLVGGALTKAPGARVVGEVQREKGVYWGQVAEWMTTHTLVKPWWGFSVVGWLVQTAVFLVLALVAAALLPKQMRAVQRQLSGRTAGSLGWGALTFFVAVPVILIILVVSIVGLLVVLPYILFVLLAYFFATTTVAAFIAERVLGGTRHKDNLMLATALGAVGTALVSRIPVGGVVALVVMMVFGAGAVVLATAQWLRERRVAEASSSAPVGAGAGPASIEMSPGATGADAPAVEAPPAVETPTAVEAPPAGDTPQSPAGGEPPAEGEPPAGDEEPPASQRPATD